MGIPVSFDLLIRTGFRSGSDAIPKWISNQMGPCTAARYQLGTGLATAARQLHSGAAPYIVFMDDSIAIRQDALSRVFQFILSTSQCYGITLGSQALVSLYSEAPSPTQPGRQPTQIKTLPSWFAIIRRSVISSASKDSTWVSPEFTLFDIAAHASPSKPFWQLSGQEDLFLDSGKWVTDLLAKSGEILAKDYAQFRERHRGQLTVIPPQFQVETVGSFLPAPTLSQHSVADSRFPKFSIICPVFKPDFLPQMLESVKRQTWRNWELRLLIDGPPKSTQQLIEAILLEHGSDSRISFATQTIRGTGPTRNILASAASGDFIFPMDDDD